MPQKLTKENNLPVQDIHTRKAEMFLCVSKHHEPR